jgi:hypothetical protein
MNKRILLPALAALTLGACATPYQKNFIGGGYSDKKIDESTYVVSFNGNGYASKERVWYFWIYRCAELTTEKGYAYFAIRPNAKATSLVRENDLMPAVYQPGRDGRFINVKGSSAPIYIYTPGTSFTTWSSNATVHMFPEVLPGEQMWAFSAKSVFDQLKPYVTSNGSALAPSRAELFKQAFRTRDHIVIGDRIRIGTTGPFTEANAPAGFQPRSAASIRNGLDASRLLMLQLAYSDYSLRTLDAFGGDVVLSFVISPSGVVKNVRAVSSTVKERMFVQNVMETIHQTNFGGTDAIETRVDEFPITFAPRSGHGADSR